jgi:hypothetical protein
MMDRTTELTCHILLYLDLRDNEHVMWRSCETNFSNFEGLTFCYLSKRKDAFLYIMSQTRVTVIQWDFET